MTFEKLNQVQNEAFEYLSSLMVLECTSFDLWFYLAQLVKQDCVENNNLELYKKVETFIHERMKAHQE